MSATFDATTTAEYAAATTEAARSAVIVAALTGTISVKVFNGSDVERGSGTMDSPWATASGNTVTVGEVTSFTVGTTATPDANWYIRFQNAGATRWVRGSFGLAASGQDFTWSLSTWTATHTGTIGTATITTSGNSAPAFTVAPTTSSIAAEGGTIQFTAVDPEGSVVIYSLTTTRNGITINSSTGLVTVTAAAAGTSGNIVVQASDGILTATATCAVTVASANLVADFIIPANVSSWNAATSKVKTDGTSAIPNNVDGAVIELSASNNTSVATAGTRGPLEIQNLAGIASERMTVRNPSVGAVTISGAQSYLFELNTCSYVLVDGSNGGQTYGISVECATSTSSGTSLIKYTGRSHHIELAHFSVDGKRTSFVSAVTPTGLSMHDGSLTPDGTSWHDGHTVRNFYIRRVPGEGVYCGSNYTSNALPMKNINIYDGIVEDTGRDGIQGKNWWGGINTIRDIVCRRVGRNTNDSEAGQQLGIDVTGGHVSIYNCKVFDSGESGIRAAVQNGPNSGDDSNATGTRGYGALTFFNVEMYNNLVKNAGLINGNTGHGLNAFSDSPLRVLPLVEMYNNTVVDCEGAGINFSANVSGGTAQNNILLDNGSATSNGSGATINNNLTSGTQAAIFVAPGAENYHLAGEQAVTAGLKSSFDIEGTSRAGTASKGAYEFS